MQNFPVGLVRGPGTGTSDSIVARVSNGEYILPKAAVDMIGKQKLNKLKNAANAMRGTPRYALGGMIDETANRQISVNSGMAGQENDMSTANSMNRAADIMKSMRTPDPVQQPTQDQKMQDAFKTFASMFSGGDKELPKFGMGGFVKKEEIKPDLRPFPDGPLGKNPAQRIAAATPVQAPTSAPVQAPTSAPVQATTSAPVQAPAPAAKQAPALIDWDKGSNESSALDKVGAAPLNAATTAYSKAGGGVSGIAAGAKAYWDTPGMTQYTVNSAKKMWDSGGREIDKGLKVGTEVAARLNPPIGPDMPEQIRPSKAFSNADVPAKSLTPITAPAPSELQVAGPGQIVQPKGNRDAQYDGVVTTTGSKATGFMPDGRERYVTDYSVRGANGGTGELRIEGANQRQGGGTVSVMNQGNGGTVEGNVAALNRQTEALRSLREAQNPGITTGTGRFGPSQEAPSTDPFGGDSEKRAKYESLINEAANEKGWGASKRAARKMAAAEAMLAPGAEQAKLRMGLHGKQLDTAAEEKRAAIAGDAAKYNARLDSESAAAQRESTLEAARIAQQGGLEKEVLSQQLIDTRDSRKNARETKQKAQESLRNRFTQSNPKIPVSGSQSDFLTFMGQSGAELKKRGFSPDQIARWNDGDFNNEAEVNLALGYYDKWLRKENPWFGAGPDAGQVINSVHPRD